VVDYKLEQKTVPIEKAAPAPVVVKDSVKDSIPVVDYQVMVLRNDSIKKQQHSQLNHTKLYKSFTTGRCDSNQYFYKRNTAGC
jgi:hypothetical protein